jgi:hypothetical protein
MKPMENAIRDKPQNSEDICEVDSVVIVSISLALLYVLYMQIVVRLC